MSTSKRFVTKNGLDNNGNSITNLGVSGASLTLAGANALTFTTTGSTGVTLPTSGTLVSSADTGTVTNTMLAGSIANAKLLNSSVTVGSTNIALGATATTLAGLSSVTSTSFVGALTGNATTATSATTAGTVTTAAQPAITSVGTLSSLAVTGDVATQTLTLNTGYIYRAGGTAPAYYMSQDGTGRQHWYWNTSGGLSPTFAVAAEDAMDIMMSVNNSGIGGSFFFRTADGVGKTAGQSLSWTNAMAVSTTNATFTGALAGSNLSGTNTGDETTATIKSKLGITTLSGSNTGDQTISITGDVTASGSTGALSATVTKINGTTLSGLATGLLKNTTGTGVPSIAVQSDVTALLGTGSITNTMLANKSLTVGSTNIALGATATTLAGLSSVTSTSFVGALTGNASSATTASTVTTNANLTGPITSVGNATSIASQTGTGTTFVMSANPTITGLLGISGTGVYLPASTNIASASGMTSSLSVTSQGTAGTAGAAFLTFHRPGAYAMHVGVDTDNSLKVGGYSMGAVSYKIWHEGNDGTGSGLDADLLDGQHGSYYAPLNAPVFTGIPRATSLNIGADTDIYLYESSTNAFSIRTGAAGTPKYFTFGNDGTLSVVSGGITTTDRILVAGSTAVTQSNGETAYLQLNGTDSRWGIGLSRFSANANGTGIYLGKSRGATVGTLGIVSSGDELGRITFSGDDGTDLNTIAAKITAYVDGTPGLNDMPGRLVLSTTADGASTPTDRVTIDSIGEVLFSSCGVKIQTSRRVTSDIDTQFLELRGGTGSASANIELYGGTHATFAGLMVLDAGEHRIRSADGTSEWARIDSTGNVGIGTSTSPVVKLYVYDSGSSTTLQEYGQLVQANFTNISGAINKFGIYGQAYTGASYAGTGAVIGVAGLAQQNAASAGAGFSLIGVLGSITTTSTGTVGNACAFQSGLTTSGGATITNGIAYLAEDHSVGTSKYGFYSSLSSGTNKYGFYSAGTAPNYFAGSLGIGGLPVTGYKILNYGNYTGSTTYYATSTQGTFQSDVTNAAVVYRSAPNTAAAAFTLPSMYGYLAEQGTIGAGSTVTSQHGFHAAASLVGATNNYGFYGNIPAGSNRYNLYMGGTADNYLAGKLGVGTTVTANTFFRVSGSGTGTDTSTILGQGTTTASSSHNVFYSLPTTSATTLNVLTHFFASQSTLGGTVNNQYGFRSDTNSIGATNNYAFLAENTAAVTTGKTAFGFYSNVNTATGGGSTWGFFANGTANNAFNGKVRVGGITVPSATLDVTGTIASTGAITASGGVDKLTTASGTVSVAAATAPTSGQVLTATSATTATWQTPSGGSVTISDDTATNATYYPAIATATSGTLSTLKVSSTKFTFNPSTGTASATLFNSLSDANFKTNVAPLTNSADVVKALQGVSFDWKDGSGSSYGFIAQEVQKIIPHAVSESDGKLGVNYAAVVPFLVETIKTQEDRIARLEELVSKLLAK